MLTFHCRTFFLHKLVFVNPKAFRPTECIFALRLAGLSVLTFSSEKFRPQAVQDFCNYLILSDTDFCSYHPIYWEFLAAKCDLIYSKLIYSEH